MERKIATLSHEKNYLKILELVKDMTPAQCNSADMAQAVAAAWADQRVYTAAADWYCRHFALEESDEALGMAVDLLLATGQLSRAQQLLQHSEQFAEEFYYRAAQVQLAFRQNADMESQIEALEAFLDIQEEESYMLRLATCYIRADREKEAGRLCRKIGRLFISGKAVEYAAALQEQLRAGSGADFLRANPWYADDVFPHLSFDPAAPMLTDAQFALPTAPTSQPAPAKAAPPAAAPGSAAKSSFFSSGPKSAPKPPKPVKEDRIAPIVEGCLKDVIGMQELRVSLNNVFNMLQIARKKVSFVQILKDNLRIYGPDGCGKTTAAMAAAAALQLIGITGTGNVKVADYYSLVGATPEETHNNVAQLFQDAENGCVILDNIHEFNDSGAYSQGLDAIDQVVKAYQAADGKIPLIITGSEKETEDLLAAKKRLADLFNLPVVHLGKYTTEELVKIANRLAGEKNLILDDEACQLLSKRLDHMAKQADFKYSRDLETMINNAYIRHSARLSKMRRPSERDYYVLTAEDFDTTGDTETVEELLQQLDRLTGLAAVKTQVNKIVKQMQVQKLRQEAGIASPQGHGSLHLVFLGNAGTGKTTVARIIGKIYKRLGVLPTGQLVECTRRDLVSQYVGATSQKVAEKVKEAMGGILFIDEAYTLCKEDNDSFGREAIDALLTDIENHRDNLMVILAGYGEDMQKFMDQNQGLRSRIPTDIFFDDYSTEEMVDIFKMNVKNRGLIMDVGLEEKVHALIDERKRQKNFGNARGVRNLFEEILLNQDTRLGSMDPALLSKNDFLIIRAEDLPAITQQDKDHKSVRAYLDELNAMTGLAAVKDKVQKIVSTVEVNQAMAAMGLHTQAFGTLHMVFKGNAGTGKTTVARLIGGIYRELGVLSSGHLVECDRSALVGQYVGTTAPKVKAKVQEAMGGILFIDEAYALAKGGENDFGKEAIDTLVADIENYRKDLMVIIAGYNDDMEVFLEQNQGLRSRFPNEILFEDYTPEELLSIFKGNITARGLVMEPALDEVAFALIRRHAAVPNFGNARGVRNLVDKLCEQRNVRIAGMFRPGYTPTKEDLQTIIRQDLTCLL